MTEFEDWIKQKEARRSRKNAPKSRNRDSTQPKRQVRRKRRKGGFSEETRSQAQERNGGKCENPLCGRQLRGLGGEHHCLPRSQYKRSDRNDLWNCAAICEECHHRVTFPRTDEDIRLRRYFELVAIARRSASADTASILDRYAKELRENTLDLIRQYHTFTK